MVTEGTGGSDQLSLCSLQYWWRVKSTPNITACYQNMEVGCGCKVMPPSSTTAVHPDLTVLSVWTMPSRESVCNSPCKTSIKQFKCAQYSLLFSFLFFLFLSFGLSDNECKELQLSEDQRQATKSGLSITSSLGHCRQLRTKAVKMKTKLREAPYLEVGPPLDCLIITRNKLNVL